MSVLILVSNGDMKRSKRICSQDQHAQAQHWLRHALAQLMHAQARAQAQHWMMHAQAESAQKKTESLQKNTLSSSSRGRTVSQHTSIWRRLFGTQLLESLGKIPSDRGWQNWF